MPIQLKTPFSPGDLDTGKEYAQVRISSFKMNLIPNTILLRIQYGNTVSGEWEPGVIPEKNVAIRNDRNPEGPQHYSEMIAKTSSAADASLYSDVSTELYRWLLANEIFEGSIV